MNKALTEKIAVGMGAGATAAKMLANACDNWGIHNPLDQARFLAQLHVESGAFKRLEENLNYSATRLLQVFPGRNGMSSLLQAQQVCRGGPRAIANLVYGGAWGKKNLGNTGPDDGWDFRGRGFIQTTGRENYTKTSIAVYGDRRLVNDQGMLAGPEAAADAAAWFWHNRSLNGVSDVRAITRKINGGTHGLPERVKQTTRALNLVAFFTGT